MNKFIYTFCFYFLFIQSVFAENAPESFADLVEGLIPGVVSISSSKIVQGKQQPEIPEFPEGSPFDEFFKDYFDRNETPSERNMIGLGSGFIIDNSGIVVTNNHVIEGANEIKIILSNQKEFEAELLGRDPKSDLAVLKFDPDGIKLTSLNWGNSDEVRVGDWTIAIGNPLGLGGSVTAGIVSAMSRNLPRNGPYVEFIQTDASINMGNSGGPLININGKVIGINTAIMSQSGGSIGLGFAIPSNSAIKIVNQLKEFGRTKRGWLGVQITPVSKEIAESLGLPDEKGAFVSNLNPEGPSKSAGIQEGDVILKFNNIEINEMIDLPRLVAESDIGSTALVELWRKNKKISIKVKLGELPEKTYVERKVEKKTSKNEFFVDSLELLIGSTLGDDGVTVLKYEGESNLIQGDIITEVNREPITNLNSFINLVKQINDTGRNSLLLKIIRDEKSLWVTIQFSK